MTLCRLETVIRRWFAVTLMLLAACAAAAPPPSAELPPDSIYQLDIALQDQEGRSFHLAELRGTVYVVSMFYSSCQYACPTTIETVKHTLAQLPESRRGHARALMVSFDPKRDTVSVLERVAQEHGLDPQTWTLARTDEASARKLAAVLGVQYRALPDGDFNHNTRLLLIDRDGRIAGQTERIGKVEPTFVDRLRELAP